ncbi:snoRNA-binding protein [Dimargaris xerosporica]|nr:snoRNA-binding protein [Dimargaris xerosporica]
MGKSKSSKSSKAMEVDVTPTPVSTQAKRTYISPIAHPLSSDSLAKDLLGVAKKATPHKHVVRGVRDVVRAIRKGSKGLAILAADSYPVDTISHVPVLCEDNQIPYVFVPSKRDLGVMTLTKRPTTCVLIVPGGKMGKDKQGLSDYQTNYDQCFQSVKSLNDSIAL